ncbi:MAG: helix-turn-helix domain-containing protein [Nocardioidaceae bacterium]|nr:helix-turn-helix domain-containing protein [Nocardioidaceae bacterium]
MTALVAYSYSMQMLDGVVVANVREAAALAHRTPETIRRWVWSGKLPARRQGNRLLIRREDLDRLLGGAEQTAAGPLALAEWAELVERTLGPGRPGASARDLIQQDRRDRDDDFASR